MGPIILAVLYIVTVLLTRYLLVVYNQMLHVNNASKYTITPFITQMDIAILTV